MASVLYGLAVLACPVGMGTMMWIMMRGRRDGSGHPTGSDEVAELRAEIARLKADRMTERTTSQG